MNAYSACCNPLQRPCSSLVYWIRCLSIPCPSSQPSSASARVFVCQSLDLVSLCQVRFQTCHILVTQCVLNSISLFADRRNGTSKWLAGSPGHPDSDASFRQDVQQSTAADTTLSSAPRFRPDCQRHQEVNEHVNSRGSVTAACQYSFKTRTERGRRRDVRYGRRGWRRDQSSSWHPGVTLHEFGR